jgi:hypothetical protein
MSGGSFTGALLSSSVIVARPERVDKWWSEMQTSPQNMQSPMQARNAAAWARVGAISAAAAVWAIGCFSASTAGPQDAGGDADTLLDATATADAPPSIDAPPDQSTADASTAGFEEAGALDAPSEAPAEAAPGDAPYESGPVDAGNGLSEGGDAATDAGIDSGEAGGCSFVGTWTGTYSCSTMDGVGFSWAVNADGTAVGTIGDAGTVHQTWSITGNTLHITDTSGSACSSSTDGVYTVAFSASCNQATLTEVDDLCTGRGNCVGGLVCARQ